MNKRLLIISIGRLSQMIIMFATYRVLSTVLSVADMGTYYFLLSIAGAFGLIFANPIGMYANRMLLSWNSHGVLLKNLKIIITTFALGSFLTAPLLFLFKSKFNVETNSLSFIACTLILYIFSTSINGTLVPSLNLMGFVNHFVLWTLMTNLIGLILSVALVKYYSPDPLYWLIGQGVAFIFFGFVAYFVLWKKLHGLSLRSSRLSFDRLKRVGHFAIPIVITNVSVWLLAQSFRFFLKEKIDANALGELTFGLGLATSLSVAVEYLFQQLFFPAFYAQINDPNIENEKVWNNLMNRLLPSYTYLAFFIMSLSPFLMRILADPKFKNSGNFLALGALVEFFRMLGNVFGMATHSEMKTHKAIGPYLIGGAIALGGVLLISYHPLLVTYTPFCLMTGYAAAMFYLKYNVSKMFEIKIATRKLLKSIAHSSLFLTALFFKQFSGSLVGAVLTCFSYGLLLLFLLYGIYENKSEILA